ncbi:methionyl-tRNA formyltransferase [Halorussus aquaticus]|uniref:Methionyl-tRNA formyltransferase n=2 Tax=Halorussus aquaticus TaxID=2953748 RepID=A0ABD5Q5W9_9EURY|nr:formyltransferase family protein [Halorussus aquaticus]
MITIGYFGSHPLGETCLELLYEHDETEVSAVVTYPEGYDSWWSGSVREVATDLGYPVISTENEDRILDYEIDYIVSVYYPNILGEELLSHPSEGALNLHQAELPRYRGSNVFSHAILNARADDHWKYGTTIHFMAEEVDAGDIVDRKFVDITETDTARSLYEKTREKSVELFKETIPKIVSGEVHDMRISQEEFEGEQYFYPKSSLDGEKEIPLKELCKGDFETVYDKIRALDFPPFKPSYTVVNGQEIHLTLNSYEDLDL